MIFTGPGIPVRVIWPPCTLLRMILLRGRGGLWTKQSGPTVMNTESLKINWCWVCRSTGAAGAVCLPVPTVTGSTRAPRGPDRVNVENPVCFSTVPSRRLMSPPTQNIITPKPKCPGFITVPTSSPMMMRQQFQPRRNIFFSRGWQAPCSGI